MVVARSKLDIITLMSEGPKHPSPPLTFEVIRERPAMYLGHPSAWALSHFLYGYQLAWSHTVTPGAATCPLSLPRDFHDWVTYRLHAATGAKSWATHLTERYGDGLQSIHHFFRLLDEYRTRQPRVVAILAGPPGTYIRTCGGVQESVPYPSTVELVAFNDTDPGLFISIKDVDSNASLSFRSSGSWFLTGSGPKPTIISIEDPISYHRWLSQDAPPRI